MTEALDSLPAEEVLQRVEKVWSLSGPFPLPQVPLSCPTCGTGEFTPRYWRFFKRVPDATVPHRCDVGMKCNTCSLVLTFGIPIPKEVYDKAPDRERQILRRDAVRWQRDEGNGDTVELIDW